MFPQSLAQVCLYLCVSVALSSASAWEQTGELGMAVLTAQQQLMVGRVGSTR